MEFDSQENKAEKFGIQNQSSNISSTQFLEGQNLRRSITDLPPPLISDILEFLEPKELGIVCCVSSLLNQLASENRVWKEAYCERWISPNNATNRSWKELFVEREFRSRTLLGRYNVETLRGHTEAVRTVFLLASAKLIFTSGYDSVVRMWNVESGCLIASSPLLNCTIRAISADPNLLIVGGTVGFIQGWKACDAPHLFDLAATEDDECGFKLWEHQGPITSLAMDTSKIYSGSWDMTVRVWDRASLQSVEVLMHNDWVWSVVPYFSIVATSSGPDVYIWNAASGTLLSVISEAHAGNTYALAGSRTGNFLFTGGEDGAIKMFEILQSRGTILCNKKASWTPHSGPVYSLAFEYPWLVSASSDGKLSLTDTRNLLKEKENGRVRMADPPQRMLHGFGPNLFSVAVGDDRVICGGEGGVVRIWDFSESLEVERRALALRAIRLQGRLQRRKMQTEKRGKKNRPENCALAAKMSPERDVSQRKAEICAKLRA